MSALPSTRRDFLRTSTVAVAGATTIGAAAGSASAQSEYDGYLDDVGNYDGSVVDETDADEVTIDVGADGNGGPFGFGPPAVQVTPGTTIVWEWVEDLHNVVDVDGAFESEMTDEVGHTFEQTVEEPGVIEYYCAPHEGMGMKGVVDVVDESESGGSESGNGGGNLGGTGDGVGPVIPSVLALAFVLPAAFAALTGRDSDEQD